MNPKTKFDSVPLSARSLEATKRAQDSLATARAAFARAGIRWPSRGSVALAADVLTRQRLRAERRKDAFSRMAAAFDGLAEAFAGVARAATIWRNPGA